ncbi:MAG: CrcB family protein [Propionibacteriales bacterium]|nr:CrcB family protein [Propionibacteriales bacterium]
MATTWPRPDAVALVAVGGAVGALSRYGVAVSVAPVDGLPVGILGVNVLGAFLLGLLTATVASTRIRLLLGTGLMGGFTTYSAFALDTQSLLADGRAADTLVYLLATLAGGFAASVGGLAAGRALRTRGAR